MISSQKLRPLDHEAGLVLTVVLCFLKTDHPQLSISILRQIRNILSTKGILDAQLGKGIQEQGTSKQNNRQLQIKTLRSSGKYVRHS